MRLMSFLRTGRAAYGAVRGAAVVDLTGPLGSRYPDLKALLAAAALGEARAVLATATGSIPLTDIEFLPVIPNPDKIFCVGMNYEMHRQETGRDATPYPTIFTRFAASQLGHGQPAWRPRLSSQFDYEGELAVVIGRAGRYIRRADALDHIAGYSCYCDLSVRDWQLHTTQFTPGKNFPRSGGFGPWLVTRDEIADPTRLELSTRVNGETVQHARVADMVFPIAVIIEYLSSFIELTPGDVIATGTPGGVGQCREPPLWLQPGDVVEVEISAIGTLTNPVIAEP